MRNYQISLYKKLLSSDGHEFDCLQWTFDVTAESPDLAIATTRQNFKTGKYAPYWIDRADNLKVEERS